MTTDVRRKPRQLDIIIDTALAAAAPAYLRPASLVKNVSDLSTAPTTGNVGDLSTARRRENVSDLSTAQRLKKIGDPIAAMKKIEARRKELDISVAKLCAMAEIHHNTYRMVQKLQPSVTGRTLIKLTDAIERMAKGEKPTKRRSLLQSWVRFLTADMARRFGLDVETVLATNFEAENSNDERWLQGSRMRRYAMYLLVEGVGIEKATIGHSVGISRQAVFKAIAVTEMERDRDAQFDRTMREAMIDVVGEK